VMAKKLALMTRVRQVLRQLLLIMQQKAGWTKQPLANLCRFSQIPCRLRPRQVLVK